MLAVGSALSAHELKFILSEMVDLDRERGCRRLDMTHMRVRFDRDVFILNMFFLHLGGRR